MDLMLKNAFISFWLLWASEFPGVQPDEMGASSFSRGNWMWKVKGGGSSDGADIREPEEPRTFYSGSAIL